MKLIKAYIENFGKLNKFEYSFDEKLALIKQDNGWGKTTLANFIKVMFYGLVNKSRTDAGKNERLKYKPWQGGNFGGYLEFEVNLQKFRVTRFFGETESQDTFELINLKTNKPDKSYSSNLGEEIFKLDVDGFERSTYINENSVNFSNKESIKKKLVSLLEDSDDNHNFNLALINLDKKRQELKNKQNNGLIPETENKINLVTRKIEILNNLKIELSAKKNSLEKIEYEIAEQESLLRDIKQGMQKAQQEQQDKIILDNYNELNKKLSTLQTQVINLEDELNGNIPTQTDIVNLENLYKNLSTTEVLTEQKQKEITETSALIKNYEKFNKVDDVSGKVNEYLALNEQLKVANLSNSGKSQRFRFSVLNAVLLGIMLALLGLVVYFIISKLDMGIILLPVFLLGLNAAVIILINRKQNKNKLKDSSGRDGVNEEISQFIYKLLGKVSSENYFNDLIEVKEEYNKYLLLLEKNKELTDELKTLNENKITVLNSVKQTLSLFGINNFNNLEQAINLVKSHFNNYLHYSKLIQEKLDEINNYKNKYKIKNMSLFSNLAISLEELMQSENICETKLEKLKNSKAALNTQITQLAMEIDMLPELESEKENLTDLVFELETKFKVIVKTMEYLKDAQNEISSKYLTSMHTSFINYTQQLTNEDMGKSLLNVDLKLTFERFGKNYEIEYFSKGYKHIIDFAMRLALVDVLFGEQKPFIILDDPFASLDEGKIELVNDVLKVISQKFQIIYLICHDSRKI